MTAEQAMKFGLIDKVLSKREDFETTADSKS
jgi:ATP-dependent protease ClpP protease subunit